MMAPLEANSVLEIICFQRPTMRFYATTRTLQRADHKKPCECLL